ncbi:MAG: hypothetical protein JXR76_05070 [Deltaproteobacteria bacterium]|nr:hypothetical protein [Deltaproteobacteria bacterium]
MKISDASIDIRPRSSSEITDLAVLFYRKHFPLLFSLTAIYGFPAVILAMSVHYFVRSGWVTLGTLALLLPLLSGAVVLAASRIVFGSVLTVRDVLRLYRPVWARYFGRRFVENIVSLALTPVILGYVMHLNFSFTGPVGLLEQLRGKELRIRRKGLLRRGGGNALVFDFISVMLVALFTVGAISLVELMLGSVFTVWQETGIRTEDAMDDPFRFGIWMAVGVMAYPIYVLGWFFRYLDARIRAEGWDLELDFRRAATRLSKGDES